ncbi:hypothetical protein [Desulfofustis glycolicus]|uniref:Uncharacterized protein n=1 Tax=Desulfofustis glycolicus DSM 9705 TaxID=1121409 RepID=A0A1M5X9M8_9BACT|nr:hypothetical protein [Desulfofustis glycolicus]MCB2218133.1 hypothetical protein [Desulfobulbaceae bacterium]SHH96234.1 hypothetical protein SAMN02745124_02869 [Desulfofustis glycolicus DSM 9705]
MSDEAMEFLSYAEALKIVAAIQEEEDIHDKNRRVLTVYNYDDRELCWFDFDEVMAAVGEVPAGERKQSVQDYILKHIPTWALDI